MVIMFSNAATDSSSGGVKVFKNAAVPSSKMKVGVPKIPWAIASSWSRPISANRSGESRSSIKLVHIQASAFSRIDDRLPITNVATFYELEVLEFEHELVVRIVSLHPGRYPTSQ